MLGGRKGRDESKNDQPQLTRSLETESEESTKAPPIYW